MKVEKNDTLQYTRYYFGSYELTEYPDASYKKDTWFTADKGIFGFNRKTSTTDSTYFILKDHLGSVMAVAGEDGEAREFYSYDAWGRRRNASDWTYDTTLTVNYTSRGYTGHEHIDETWLINMNGRVYDPLVGLFLSPDPMLQEPMNPLNYNRYSYVLNNPLKFTDPSGYIKVARNYEEEAILYQIQTIIDDWSFRNENEGRPGGGGGYATNPVDSYRNSVAQGSSVSLIDVIKAFDEATTKQSQNGPMTYTYSSSYFFYTFTSKDGGETFQVTSMKRKYEFYSFTVDNPTYDQIEAFNQIMSSDNINFLETSNSIAALGASIAETSLIASRIKKSIHFKIGTFNNFSSKLTLIKTASTYLTYSGTALTVLSIGSDAIQLYNGEITNEQFTYRTLTSSSLLYTAYAAGGVASAFGAVAIWGCEQMWENWFRPAFEEIYIRLYNLEHPNPTFF